jgi:hypothetical protein
MGQQLSAAQVAQMNANARFAFLKYGKRFRKNLVTVTSPIGQTTRVQLFNAGVLTKLLLRVQCDITIGTAAAVASSRAPWNLINRLSLVDYDGQNRINLSGFQLWVLNCVRKRQFYGSNNQAGAAVITNPLVPTAVGNSSIEFFIEVPVAYDVDNPDMRLQDTRGAILAQTNVGQMFLNIDWNTSLYTNGDIDSVYSGAATTTVVGQNGSPITLTVWQDVIMPQPVPGSNAAPALPMSDFQTVYELNGAIRSTDNLAVGSEKLLDLPNVREVYGAYYNYVTGGAVSAENLSQLRMLVNGNTVLQDNSNDSQLFTQREMLNTDLVAGSYFFDTRQNPIMTAIYGNVQAGLTPATVSGGNQYVEICYESMYPKGLALPGIAQAG